MAAFERSQSSTKTKPDAFAPASSAGEETSLTGVLVKTFRSAGVAVAVWFWGYYGFSIAWVFIALFCQIAHREFRKQKIAKKLYAKHAVMDERIAIQSRVDDNLSWVYFPDVEKAEWVNKIIKQMWPYIGEYVEHFVRATIEPSVDEVLVKNNLKNFKFGKIDMGDVPPRIDGLKVYSENMKKGEIICDLEINYQSDVNIKVTVQGIQAGIKTIMLTGTLRLVMKPLVNDIPIIGGVTAFFLNKPTLDFDLTAAANLLDMPLLNKSLRSVVEDQISNYLVLPNRFPIALSSLIDEATLDMMKYPLPQGVIALHVLEATELKAADKNLLGKETSDPYCKITVGANTMKTATISGNLNPTWNQFFEIVVDEKHGQFIVLDVFDKDQALMDDDSLGNATIDIELMAKAGSIDVWLPLENVKTGKIHLQATWLYLSKSLQQAKLVSGTESMVRYSAAVLIVTVKSATKLPVGEKSRTERNSYVRLTLGRVEKKTTVKMLTCEPQWNENFQFLVESPDTEQLMIEVTHHGTTDKKIAGVNIPLNSIPTTSAPSDRVIDLVDCGSRTKLNLRLCMRLLTTVPTVEEDDPFTTSTTSPQSSDKSSPVDSPQQQGSGEHADRAPVQQAQGGMQRSAYTSLSPESAEGYRRDVLGHTGQSKRVASRESTPTRQSKWGKIRLTVRYSTHRGQLVVVVHECEGLIPCDKDNLADPYVRIYVLPDSMKSTKKKTKMIKNSLAPVFDETFEWTMTLADASSRALDISVKNDVTLFSKSRADMGSVIVDLSRIGDLLQATTAWFDLHDPAQK